jgi:hypothetical protein
LKFDDESLAPFGPVEPIFAVEALKFVAQERIFPWKDGEKYVRQRLSPLKILMDRHGKTSARAKTFVLKSAASALKFYHPRIVLRFISS